MPESPPELPREPDPGEPGGPGDGETPPRPTRSHRFQDALVSLVALAAMAALANVRGVWIVQAAEFMLLLTVPGLLLVRALRVEPEAIRRFPVYVLAGSLAVLMAAGLLVDLVGPAVGIARPLTTIPLAVSISAVCLALLTVTVIRRAPPLGAYIGATGSSLPVHRLWPLVLPVIAWIGAMRLNNGHDAAVAITAVAVTGVVLLAGVWGAQRWSVAQTAVLIYGASLALIWGFSMRGHFVYGFDINTEYQAFVGTLHAGRWHVSHPNDAYGAMLSLTILPSALSVLTGASPLLVLKVIFPFLFAFFPVAVFLLATRALRLRFAYLAVLFIVIQNYLYQQLPGIARQEIALLFFVCLVSALFDSRLRRAAQIGLLGVLGIGLVVSHYGTTYVAVVVLAIAVVLELGQSMVRAPHGGPRARIAHALGRSRRLALVPLLSTLALTAGAAAIWYQPVTGSAQNVANFATTLSSQGLSLLPNSHGAGILQSYLSGNVVTRVSARSYAALIHREYAKTAPYVHPLPQAFLPKFRVKDATVPGQEVKSQLAVSALGAVQVLVSELAILLAVIGAFWLWWRRDAGDTARGLAVLGVATLGILVLIRLSGTLANDYNQNRAFLQAMVPLSVCMAWVLERASTRPRFGPFVAGVTAAALGLAFLTTSDLRAVVTGGGSLTNIANNGEDYERYYVTQPELAAARWLVASAPPNQIISADRYGALRIVGAAGRTQGVLANVTPTSLDRGAWIYAYTANFLGGRARGQEGSQYATYKWPSFIGLYWNLVYSNGSSAVYARTP